MKDWIARRVGIVRLRQVLEELAHRLAFLPIVAIVVGVLLSQFTLAVDRTIDPEAVPLPLSTTAASSRALFGAVAGGLITAVTLLLSIMLVAVQVASGQFSPRTLRNWLGDAVLRRSVAVVLGTTVYCLMGLRSVRDDGATSVIPTTTVLVAVLAAVISLMAMIQAVDHVTRNLQVGTVARTLVSDTIATIETHDRAFPNERPAVTPPAPGVVTVNGGAPDPAARPVTAPASGWVQQIDEGALFDALPEDAEAWIAVAVGSYVLAASPLVHLVVADDGLEDDVEAAVRRAFAVGDTRTMQQDVGFGLQQLTDIAVRALSPGVNDPQTAQDVIVHIAEILSEIWSRPATDPVVTDRGRTIHRQTPTHSDYLRAAIDPIRHHGRGDPEVMTTLVRSLRGLVAEVQRRELAGPVDDIERMIADVVASVDDERWIAREREDLRRLARPPTG